MKEGFKARITGKVQGVWFRKYTKAKADELGLKGIVRNEPDGSVYVEAEGNPGKLDLFRNWLFEGSPLSEVENVHTEPMSPKGYDHFEIIY
jgi:acylphosphatase